MRDDTTTVVFLCFVHLVTWLYQDALSCIPFRVLFTSIIQVDLHVKTDSTMSWKIIPAAIVQNGVAESVIVVIQEWETATRTCKSTAFRITLSCDSRCITRSCSSTSNKAASSSRRIFPASRHRRPTPTGPSTSTISCSRCRRGSGGRCCAKPASVESTLRSATSAEVCGCHAAAAAARVARSAGHRRVPAVGLASAARSTRWRSHAHVRGSAAATRTAASSSTPRACGPISSARCFSSAWNKARCQ